MHSSTSLAVGHGQSLALSSITALFFSSSRRHREMHVCEDNVLGWPKSMRDKC